MTKSQIKWAQQHDWFVATTLDGAVIVREALHYSAPWTNQTHTHERQITFTSFAKLREWAGY